MILKLTIAVCDVDEAEAHAACALFESVCRVLREAGHSGMLRADLVTPNETPAAPSASLNEKAN